MRFGLIFPQAAVPHRAAELRRFLRTVDEVGFQFISTYDHVVGADVATRPDWVGPYTSANPLHEAFVLLAFASALTRLELVTGVLVLPQRQTALVAKQAAEIDLLSGGHLRLGVAVGWNSVEFETLGERFDDRGDRLEEQITVLRRFWTEESVSFQGRYHQVDRVSINPLPLQRPIPIWLGGAGPRNVRAEPRTERVLDRIGRIGDGWIAGRRPEDALASSWAAIRQAAERAGRDPGTLGLQVMATVAEARQRSEIDYLIDGWRRLGVTHIALNLGQRDDDYGAQLRHVESMEPMLTKWVE